MMSNNFAILGSAATGAAATAYQELFDSLLDIGKDRISVNEARVIPPPLAAAICILCPTFDF
ncbi:MAG: hypothetical protein MHMPM18_001088 [Marteilia pararefringens]